MSQTTHIQLPASKSIANRALIINALSYSPYAISNLSDCDDTRVLIQALDSDTNSFDIGAAGTAMRFLTALLAKTLGEWHITGSERMKQRPIRALVDALNHIGARVEYADQEGFPPLRIYGSALQGGTVKLAGGISSQYISALMMIAPYCEQGLHIELEGNIVSKAYIEMTAAIMHTFGVRTEIAYPHIHIAAQSYEPCPYTVENDWSAASYWYEWVAVMGDRTIKLDHLHKESLQGDSRVAEIFSRLGVTTTYRQGGIALTPHAHVATQFTYNFVNQPDLAQTVAVTCCLKNIPFKFTGLQTLKIKETDRIAALIAELGKMGYMLTEGTDTEGELHWTGERCEPQTAIDICTYDDHRMAMAFAVAHHKYTNLRILHPEVVSKSYPNFWKEMEKMMING